jgi:hypothetical protein
MNERIKELAEQVYGSAHYDDFKFAELIVRECAKVGDFDCPRCGHCCPRQTWAGLTDKDRQELAAEQHSWEGLCFAVEAKLKEKNT